MDNSMILQLKSPRFYQEATGKVDYIQTHISHIFLTDSHVYKFKKGVDFGFLDFTTLEKRRFYCQEELRLNRRLSPDIYLDMLPLYQDESGAISFSPIGRVVEYCVKMLRMPQERIMARMLERGEVSLDDIDAVASRLADFHQNAARSRYIDSFGSLEVIAENWRENLEQTAPYQGRTISAADHAWIAQQAITLLEQRQELFINRVTDGFIRECDGDLHSENICLDQTVHIFDCIEFNEKFRYCDTASDLAFLMMDLENHGRPELAERLIERYTILSGDTGLGGVLPLYLANRAFIRGKVESFRLDDLQISEEEKGRAATRARRFFRLAKGYLLRRLLQPAMILTCGLTGSGKSSLAAELALLTGWQHISSDITRKQLAGLPLTTRGADIYSRSWNIATYNRIYELAADYLQRGEGVILDATFIRRSDRLRFLSLAEQYGRRGLILYLITSPDLVRERLEARGSSGEGASDGNWDVYKRQLTNFEEPTEDEGELIRLDAAEGVLRLADKVVTLLSQDDK